MNKKSTTVINIDCRHQNLITVMKIEEKKNLQKEAKT